MQEARLEVLEKMIRQRQKDNDAAHSERIDHIWQRKLQERDTVLQKIQKKKMKALRKLAAKRTKVENKIEKRDIIADYANYASNVYAPRARDGPSYDKSTVNLQANFQQFDDYDGIYLYFFMFQGYSSWKKHSLSAYWRHRSIFLHQRRKAMI